MNEMKEWMQRKVDQPLKKPLSVLDEQDEPRTMQLLKYSRTQNTQTLLSRHENGWGDKKDLDMLVRGANCDMID